MENFTTCYLISIKEVPKIKWTISSDMFVTFPLPHFKNF